MKMRWKIAMQGHVCPDEHDTGLLGARSYFSGSLHALIWLDSQLEHQKEAQNVQGWERGPLPKQVRTSSGKIKECSSFLIKGRSWRSKSALSHQWTQVAAHR